jgi:hypothetical protein
MRRMTTVSLSMVGPEAFGKTVPGMRKADEACQSKEIFSNP